MSTENQTKPPQLQLDAHTQAIIEAFMSQRLREQEVHFQLQAQRREEEMLTQFQQQAQQREAEVAANEEALRAAIQSVSSQLEQAQLQSRNSSVEHDVPMKAAPITHPTSSAAADSCPIKSPNRRTRPTPPNTRASHKKAATTPAPTATSSRTLRSSRRNASTTPTPAAPQTPTPARLVASPRPSPPSAVKEKKVVKRSAAQVHRLLATEVPSDVRGVQNALKLHVRLLWGLYDPKQPPPTPDDKTLQVFATRFHDEPSVMKARDGRPLVAPSMVQVRTSLSITDRGQVAAQLRGIEDHIIEYIQACISKFGLLVWCPDLRQTPYALYNAACRIIALDTFRQALISHAYAFLAPNLSYAHDMVLLVKLYVHFVHHYQQSRYKKECRMPGSIRAADKASPQYKGRARLAEARLKFLVENNYPQRYRDLIDSKATSDDEVDPSGQIVRGRKVHLIKKRPERSVKFERWIRILDQKREEDARRDPSKRWRERTRKVPSIQQNSDFTALPEGMPIDYFDSDFYNALQPRLRDRITNLKVAMLPNVDHSFLRNADEKLDDKQFNAKYGNDIMARYQLVEEGELEDIEGEEEWLADDDEDAEMSSGDEEDAEEDEYDIGGDVEMTARQQSLAAQLSLGSV